VVSRRPFIAKVLVQYQGTASMIFEGKKCHWDRCFSQYFSILPPMFHCHYSILLSGIYNPLWVWAASFWRFRDHTQGRITVGRTPLDEWSARRRDLYLTNTHNTHNGQPSMPPAGFEPAIPASLATFLLFIKTPSSRQISFLQPVPYNLYVWSAFTMMILSLAVEGPPCPPDCPTSCP
jgi:hypothetical protein